MEWTDEGLVLGARRLGEGSVILETLTRSHGRHLGVVKGSRRHAAAIQPGNTLRLVWRARLDEHLGNFAVEPVALRTTRLMAAPLALHGVQLLAALLRLLAEREPHAELYAAAGVIVDDLETAPQAGELMARFELVLLDVLGFGLALDRCALTGASDDLAWVSPRTGRAAARAAGAGYADRLLALPAFLSGGHADGPPRPEDLAAAFRLTGYFLDRHVWQPRGIASPLARDAFVAVVTAVP